MQLSEAYCNDPENALSPEFLPGNSFILPKDVWNARTGRDFKYYPEEGQPIDIKGVDPGVFSYYLNIFQTTEDYGLPNGGGWINEQPWTMQFLTEMKWRKRKIEEWQITKG